MSIEIREEISSVDMELPFTYTQTSIIPGYSQGITTLPVKLAEECDLV